MKKNVGHYNQRTMTRYGGFFFHLSRFLRAQPPGPLPQRLNAWLHQETWADIVHGLFWGLLFFVGAPILGMLLLFWTVALVVWKLTSATLLQNVGRKYGLYQKIDPWALRRSIDITMDNENKNSPSSGIDTSTTASTAAASSSVELAVVVTGCDSGFGQMLAIDLASRGFIVFAGCLAAETGKALLRDAASSSSSTTTSSSSSFGGTSPDTAGYTQLYPLLLDITSDGHVQAAARKVQEWLDEGTGRENGGGSDQSNKESKCKKIIDTPRRQLHALVNNAGMGRIGYLDWIQLSDFEKCMDVNCYGMVRMCKAFLPLFKEQAIQRRCQLHVVGEIPSPPIWSPRILNMVSMAGTMTGSGLALTPYEVSKSAAEAFSNGLRLEMALWGVAVTTINPSMHRTALTMGVYERLQKELWEPLPGRLKKEYGQGT